MVTGAGGLIGKRLVEELEKKGYEVVALYHRETDINDLDKYSDHLKECEVIYHLAVYQNVFDKNKDEFFRVNVEGTKKIIKFLEKFKNKKFIYISTIMVKEGKYRDNWYVESKKRATQLVRKSKLNWVIVYPRTVISKNEKNGNWWIRVLTEGIPGGLRFRLGDRKRVFKFIWLDDLMEKLIACIDEKRGSQIIAEGEELEAEEYLKLMYKIRGKKYWPWRLPFIDSV